MQIRGSGLVLYQANTFSFFNRSDGHEYRYLFYLRYFYYMYLFCSKERNFWFLYVL